MTLLVRNAEDLLPANIAFHREQGVDFFIITDNRSTDATAAIAGRYVREGIAALLHESDDDYSQARWVTRMARLAAAEHGADWVINNDDDEFWYGTAGTLRDVLEGAPADVQALQVARRNHPPLWDGAGRSTIESMIYEERSSVNALGTPLPPKLCHRGYADIRVAQGNHDATRGEVPLDTRPSDTLRIAHFPIRDYEAFERKIALGGAAYERNRELPPSVGATWRRLHALWQQQGLRSWYEKQRLTPEALAQGLAAGTLLVEDRVAQAVRRVPLS
jgi:hypothetical protein